MCGLICEPSPSMKRPPDSAWTSLACSATVIGLRAKATTIDGADLDPLGALGGDRAGEERVDLGLERPPAVVAVGLRLDARRRPPRPRSAGRCRRRPSSAAKPMGRRGRGGACDGFTASGKVSCAQGVTRAHGTRWTSNRFVPRSCCGSPAVIAMRSPDLATPVSRGDLGALVEQRGQPGPLRRFRTGCRTAG